MWYLPVEHCIRNILSFSKYSFDLMNKSLNKVWQDLTINMTFCFAFLLIMPTRIKLCERKFYICDDSWHCQNVRIGQSVGLMVRSNFWLCIGKVCTAAYRTFFLHICRIRQFKLITCQYLNTFVLSSKNWMSWNSQYSVWCVVCIIILLKESARSNYNR